jgi:S1-C subfamily serine protease
VLAGLLMAVGIGESIGSAIGRTAARSLGSGVLGAADRLLGSLTGAAQALLVVWLAGGLVALGPVPTLSEAAQNSTAIRTLNAVLPPPTAIAGELANLLDDSGLPNVFVAFEPLPKPPVQQPTDAATRAIAKDAEPSTVRVQAIVCAAQASGSGVVVGNGYVVTNAHVVAGARNGAVAVATVGGDRADATVVLFDPSLDVAVLRAPDLSARPLRFATSDPDRGTVGAALGYPGGGSLTVASAAVTGAYRATGYDIYGEVRVDRDILELQAQIDRGDSGGPFVLEDGTIGGLVFAEARSDPDFGYALTPTSVATRITPALGRTDAVSTGTCLR